MLATQAIGMMASLLSFVLWVPQAVTVWRWRADPDRLAAVSMSTQMLLLANTILWCAYAALTNSFWVGASGLINAPLAVMVACILWRSRRAVPAVPVLTLLPVLVQADEDDRQPVLARAA